MIKIRKATLKDAKKIYLLKREAILKINSKDYPKQTIKVLLEKNSLKNIAQKIKQQPVFCLWKDKSLIGTISINKNIISGLAVRPSQAKKGNGKKLMEFIENYAKKKGIKKLMLYPSTTAQKFYEKLGYKKTGKTSTWKFKDKILELNVPEMEKTLK